MLFAMQTAIGAKRTSTLFRRVRTSSVGLCLVGPLWAGEGIVPTEDGYGHTEGARDGYDPRIVRRCAQRGVRQANDAAVGPRQGRRPTRQVRSERGGGEREQGVAF